MLLTIFSFVKQVAFSDFAVSMIVVLLGALVYLAQQQTKSMKSFMRENTVDHLNMEKRFIDLHVWIKTVYSDTIKPSDKRSIENEKKIIDIRGDVRQHEGRITKLEDKV